jgi:hypothetical protein
MTRLLLGLLIVVGGLAGAVTLDGSSTTVVFVGIIIAAMGWLALKPPDYGKAPHEHLIAAATDRGRVAELKSRLEAKPEQKAVVDDLLTRYEHELDTISKLDLVLHHLRRDERAQPKA